MLIVEGSKSVICTEKKKTKEKKEKWISVNPRQKPDFTHKHCTERQLNVGEMEKRFTLIHTVTTAGVFSAVSFWYGFMIGRESSRKELGDLISNLRRGNPDSPPPPPHS